MDATSLCRGRSWCAGLGVAPLRQPVGKRKGLASAPLLWALPYTILFPTRTVVIPLVPVVANVAKISAEMDGIIREGLPCVVFKSVGMVGTDETFEKVVMSFHRWTCFGSVAFASGEVGFLNLEEDTTCTVLQSTTGLTGLDGVSTYDHLSIFRSMWLLVI